MRKQHLLLRQLSGSCDLAVDSHGYIITNEEMETNLPGVFAIGDVRQKKLRQVTTAVGDGGAVMHAVEEYLRD